MSPEATLGAAARLLLDPGPDEARDALERELQRPDYQESLLQRALGWVSDLVDSAATVGTGLGWGASVVVLLVLVGLAALALSRLRRDPVRRRSTPTVFGGAPREAADHERAARAAYDSERWDEAVVESVRALAVSLTDRGLLAEQPGLTVHELVEGASDRFPTESPALARTGRAFDEVRYGDRHADGPTAREAVGLLARLAATTPVAPARGPVSAVPR